MSPKRTRNYNWPRVVHIAPPPAPLEGFPASQFSRSQRGVIEHGQPRQTITLAADYTNGRLGFNITYVHLSYR